MERTIVADDDVARAELSASRDKPQWREGRRALPFHELSPDEFEIFCFLLLRKEFSGEQIYYYGKTADAGRDIVHKRPDGTVRLVQCKRYSTTVGVNLLKAEFAKLFTNIFSETIPERPDEIVFYIVPDITSPAAGLIDKQSNWQGAAATALRKHAGKAVSSELIAFATTWWPNWDRDNENSLTARVDKFSDLRDDFFAVKKVIDASRKDIQHDIHAAIQPVARNVESILSHPLFANAAAGSDPKQLLKMASEFLSSLNLGAIQGSHGNTDARSSESLPHFDSTSHEAMLLIESKVASEIGRNLNLPSTSVLQAFGSHEPPPLPSAHIERRDAIKLFEASLRASPTLAVIGYAECGKTIALSEFARSQQCQCLWFSTPAKRPQVESNNTALLLLSLSAYLGIGSLSPDEIRGALENRLQQSRLLIIIDDAHMFGDLGAIEFLQEVATSQHGRLQVVFGSIDTPAFVSEVRSRGIAVTRMPGMTAAQAAALYRSMGIAITNAHQSAIGLLCAKCDGHVGLLRLAARAIQPHMAPTAINQLIVDAAEGLSSDATQFHSALMVRFRNSLADSEFQLCRRLTVSLGPFERRLAHALWSSDQETTAFQDAWNRCVSSVFEAHESARFSIPDLYQQGLREYSEAAEITSWHGVAADTVGEPVGAVFNILDVCDAIVHRLLSGAQERALDQACGYLALAASGKHRDVTAFLLSRFQVWLKEVANSSGTPRASRIRWYTLRTRLCWDAKRRDEADVAAVTLLSLLKSAAEASDEPDIDHAAWAVLLLHASVAGRPQLALQAFDALPPDHFSAWGAEFHGGRVFLLLSAFLQARDNPLSPLNKLINAPGDHQIANDDLWSEGTGYPFWRAVETSIYSAVDREAVKNKAVYADRVAELRKIQEAMERRGLPQVAVLLGASLARLTIDVARDFTAACEIASALVGIKGYDDVRTAAYAQHILGDALRCAGRVSDAIAAYSAALELWPNAETFDRSQSTLMLGIATSRNGDHKQGYKLAHQAAQLLRQRHPDSTMRATALLEAFAMAIYANALPAALQYLIEAHEVLHDRHQSRPEWVTLGQCAMLLAVKTEKPAEPTPIPGFTLGLRDPIPEAESMLPAAPTLMMAYASGALGRPNRAFAFLDRALSEIDSPAAISQSAYFGWEVAVKAQLLEPAAKYGAMAAKMSPIVGPLNTAVTFDNFILDHIVGKVVNLAINVLPEEIQTLDAARAAIGEERAAENGAVRVLSDSLDAIAEAYRNSDPEPLESAFQRAMRCGALFVARDLAWFWCFRFHLRQPRPTGEMLLWHWRLCWLSLSIGGTDVNFLDGFCDQQRSLWNRLKAANDDPSVHEACNILDATDVPSRTRVEHLTSCLGRHGCDYFGGKTLLSEVGHAIRHLKHREPLREIVGPFAGKCLNIFLHPAASEVEDDLRKRLEELNMAIGATTHQDALLDEWQRVVHRLLTIAEVLHEEQPTAAAFDALLSFDKVLPLLSPTSEANSYVWLRHFLGLAERNREILERVMGLLRSDRVASLLANPDVPAYLRRRLGICRAAARSQLATSMLASAIAMTIIQQQAGTTVQQSAVLKAHTDRDGALREASETVESLDAIEQELRKEGTHGVDLWSCCHERGGLRKFIGTLLCVQMNNPKLGEPWLRKALEDFRLAIAADETTEGRSPTARSATEALIIAEYLKLDAEREYFNKLLTEIAAKLRDPQTQQLLDTANSSDPLRHPKHAGDNRPPWPTEEKDIQRFVDDLMSALGLPPDRRRAVEDDVRKQIQIDEVQKKFCKHLQPLQNLTHTQSPTTSYLFKTKYTCSCTLLGHQTVIENDDIAVVIDAMQKTYCEGCDRREPIGASEIQPS